MDNNNVKTNNKMYQELEMYKTYKKEKQIKHNHEVFASISALSVIAIVMIIKKDLTIWNVFKSIKVIHVLITYQLSRDSNKFLVSPVS